MNNPIIRHEDGAIILRAGGPIAIIDTTAQAANVAAVIDKALQSGVIMRRSDGGYSVAIANVEDEERLLTLQRDLRKATREVDAMYKPTTSMMDLAKKTVLEWKNRVVNSWITLDATITRADTEFRLQQQRAADARAREANERARKESEERALAEAEMMLDAGETQAAEEHLTREIEAPPPAIHVAPEVARVAGITKREQRSATVVDLQKLVEHCAANPLLTPMYLEAVGASLNAVARKDKSLKHGDELIPGVRLTIKYV